MLGISIFLGVVLICVLLLFFGIRCCVSGARRKGLGITMIVLGSILSALMLLAVIALFSTGEVGPAFRAGVYQGKAIRAYGIAKATNDPDEAKIAAYYAKKALELNLQLGLPRHIEKDRNLIKKANQLESDIENQNLKHK